MKQSTPVILWVGRFTTLDGYGTAAHAHVSALRSLVADVVAVDIDTQTIVGPVRDGLISSTHREGSLRIRSVDPDRYVAVVVHDRPDRYGQVRASGRARVVGFSYWETNDLPNQWAGWMTSMDRVFAASEFNDAAFRRAGVPAWMIDIVGHPIDRLLLDASVAAETYRERWPERTVFMSLVSSMNQRRDLSTLFEAFATAFTDQDDVALVLKAPEGSEDAVRARLQRSMNTMPARKSGSWPTVHVIAQDLTREQLVRLHASVDCYVSCERGDGWDLPAMDSMVLGVPVISSDFGASTTFLDESDCFVVDTNESMVPSDAMLTKSHVLYTGQSWPYLDPSALAEQFRIVHGDSVRRLEAGQHAKARMRERFERSAVAENTLAKLQVVHPADVRSSHPAEISIVGKSSGSRSTTHFALSESPAVIEARFLTVLCRGARTGNPGSDGSGLRAAYRFARSHRQTLRLTPTGKLVAGVRASMRRSPLAGFAAAARAIGTAPSLPDRFGRVGGMSSLLDVAEEYEIAVEGAMLERDATSIEGDRRAVWSFAGPFRSPDADLARLRTLRNRHVGERIFIMGNGPSLIKCDLTALASEFTFGVNKIHLLFDRVDWRPDFYTVLDWKMGAAMAPHVDELDSSLKFFPERFRGVLPRSENTYWYWPRPIGGHVDDQFETDITNGIPSRATVLVTAIQQAFYLGFRDIYLIGVDGSYSIPSTVKQTGPDQFNTGVKLHLKSTADDDVNHFDPRYFGEGARWHDPNVDDMHRVFRMMRKGVERHGGRLVNATVGGAVEVLDRVSFDSLFGN